MKDNKWYLTWTRFDSKGDTSVKYFTFDTKEAAMKQRAECTNDRETTCTKVHSKTSNYLSTIHYTSPYKETSL